ncbi:MAG: hypothetical protein LUF85_10655 [Bacteroides sp.]|nr:hypothetical protein [Bacteroides sp.]
MRKIIRTIICMAFALPVVHLSAQLSDRDAFAMEAKWKAFPPHRERKHKE